MADAHANFAYSTVATAPSPATSGTSLVVAAGEGALFPATPFNATIWPAAAQPTSATAEIVRVTNRSTDTLTISRAQESTVARTVIVGDQIAATITAKTLTDVEAFAWDTIQPVGTRVEVNPWQADSANTNWSSLQGPVQLVQSGGLQPPAGSRESTGAQNAEVTFKPVLATGTWKLHLLTATYNSAGIATVNMDTVSQGTIDLYTAGFTTSVKKTLTGIAVLTSGIHDLNFKLATKNGSSSSYFGDLIAITLERTA